VNLCAGGGPGMVNPRGSRARGLQKSACGVADLQWETQDDALIFSGTRPVPVRVSAASRLEEGFP